jgi:hypothetical protein
MANLPMASETTISRTVESVLSELNRNSAQSWPGSYIIKTNDCPPDTFLINDENAENFFIFVASQLDDL